MSAPTARTIDRTTFGRQLKVELERQDISVRALARRMRPSDPEQMRRAIARWLAPKGNAVNPSKESRQAVAAALGLPDDFFTADEEGDPG